MWVEYNPNPYERRTIDCTVRALSLALDMDWDTVYLMICAIGFEQKTMPSENGVWGEALRRAGFRRYMLDNDCPVCFTAAEFLQDHRRGVYVMGFDSHVATAIDGRLFDSWNSEDEIPRFIWTKENMK